jgi:DNA-directed RNA polymerase subunit F
VEKFSKTDADRARKIKEMIMNDYQLDSVKASIIVNILPLSVPEMRTVFEKTKKLQNYPTRILKI